MINFSGLTGVFFGGVGGGGGGGDRFMKNVAVTFSVAKSISEWLLI